MYSTTAVSHDTLKQFNAWRRAGDAMAKDDRASFSSWHEPAWHSTLSKTASKAVGNNDEVCLGMYMQTGNVYADNALQAARQECKFVKLYFSSKHSELLICWQAYDHTAQQQHPHQLRH